MPEYDPFAPFYDLSPGAVALTDDIPFYTELARAAGGPVCELACGTGRILLPLAKAGIKVTGLDLSQGMLDVLQAKLDKEPRDVQSRVALRCADMRDYRFSQKFSLVICGFNSFLHLLATDDQLACLTSIREYLADDGLLCIAVFAPYHDLLAQRTMTDEQVGADNTITRYITTRNTAEQTMDLVIALDTVASDGSVRRHAAKFSLCWIHNREMHLLFRLAGYRVEHVYGGYDKRPYDYVSGRQVFVARPHFPQRQHV
jgi:SAM-dependent methyltransferase